MALRAAALAGMRPKLCVGCCAVEAFGANSEAPNATHYRIDSVVGVSPYHGSGYSCSAAPPPPVPSEVVAPLKGSVQ